MIQNDNGPMFSSRSPIVWCSMAVDETTGTTNMDKIFPTPTMHVPALARTKYSFLLLSFSGETHIRCYDLVVGITAMV